MEINSYFEYAESKFYHFAERESGWSQNTSQNENKHSLSKYAFKIWRYVWAEDIYDAVKCGMCDVLLMKYTPSHFITLLIVLLCILWELGFLKSDHLLSVERAFEFNYVMFLFFVNVFILRKRFPINWFLFQASFWEWKNGEKSAEKIDWKLFWYRFFRQKSNWLENRLKKWLEAVSHYDIICLSSNGSFWISSRFCGKSTITKICAIGKM